jgi:hypothetical protein
MAFGFAACGDDDGSARSAGRPAGDRSGTTERIVIKAHAELQDVADRGEVLGGSVLGDGPFCEGGKFTGGHQGQMIYRTFQCRDGSLRLGFIPGNGSGRTVTARWKLLGGTGAFKGARGSGRVTTVFAPGDQPAEARETFRGSVIRWASRS